MQNNTAEIAGSCTTTTTSSSMVIQPYRINNCKFQASMISFLKELHESKQYTDVVLHAEGKMLSGHRVVLAAGSGYFNTLFSTLPSTSTQSLVVALPNVKYKDLEQVVRFIYHGYVDIVDSQLENFVKLAKELRVVGMIDDEEAAADEEQQVQPDVLKKQTTSIQEPTNHFLQEMLEEDEEEENEVGTLSTEQQQQQLPPYSYMNDESIEFEEDEFDYDDDNSSRTATNTRLLLSNATSVGGGGGVSSSEKPFVCLKCGKTYNSNKSLWRHKKFTCDEKIEFTCEVCGKVFSRSDNLRRHVVVAHHQN